MDNTIKGTEAFLYSIIDGFTICLPKSMLMKNDLLKLGLKSIHDFPDNQLILYFR